MISRLAIAASGCETAQSPNAVPHRQTRRKRVARGKRRHVMLSQKPPGYDESRNQAARKNSSGLQRVKAENFSQIASEADSRFPIEDHVKNLSADNSGKHHGDAEVPGVLRFNSLLD